jgi:hypothetical protein
MDHDFFSKHVTHVVWDVSQFQRELAYNIREYGDVWMASPGSWNTPELQKSWRQDRVSLAKMLRYEPREEPGPLPGDECLEWADEVSQFSDEDDYEHARNIVGFADYHHRYNIQRCIRDRKLIWRYFLFATNRLPNLRHIEYTDSRVLSLQGESYQDLCQRLFGQTLHPQHLCHNSVETERAEQDDAAKYHGWESLDRFLKYVSTMEWKPESLSTGRNNFDLPELDRRDIWDYGRPVNSPELDLIKPLTSESSQWFASLKALHLPITSTPTPDSRYLPQMCSYTELLSCTAASLEDLSLSTDWYKREPWALGLHGSARSIFEILSPFKFDKLKSLELRGWRFSLQELETFLFAHTDTLRYIHLIDCQLNERYGGAYNSTLHHITQTWPKQLNLRGAEAIGLRFPIVPSTSTSDVIQPAPHKHRCERYVYDVPAPEEYPPPDQEQHPLSLCPGPRPEFEAGMLGGRYNSVVTRSPRQTANFKYHWEQWEEIPINPYG